MDDRSSLSVCVRACVRVRACVCVRARVCVCMCVCVHVGEPLDMLICHGGLFTCVVVQ